MTTSCNVMVTYILTVTWRLHQKLCIYESFMRVLFRFNAKLFFIMRLLFTKTSEYEFFNILPHTPPSNIRSHQYPHQWWDFLQQDCLKDWLFRCRNKILCYYLKNPIPFVVYNVIFPEVWPFNHVTNQMHSLKTRIFLFSCPHN